MKRTLRLALVAMAALAITGLAFTVSASAGCGASSCGTKTAEAKSADAKSAADCAAACAAAGKTCTPAQAAACAAKGGAEASPAGSACTGGQAAEAAMADCSYCGFMSDLHANVGKVKFSTQETKNGVIVVFTAVTKDDVPVAHAVATKAYAMMSKPGACAVTKAKMAETSCDGCKKGLDAFAHSTVTMEETQDGSRAQVTTEDEKTVEQIHAFFRALQDHGSEG